MQASYTPSRGFTIVELIIVVVVIAVLASIVAVGYGGIQASARDKSLLSDIDAVESELARYASKNVGLYDASLVWDSSKGSNPNINFAPSSGNTVRVVAYGDGYCVKAFNPRSNMKTLATAAKKGSDSNACSTGLLSVSGSGMCGITSDLIGVCWGDNFYGRLGNLSVQTGNSNSQTFTPVPIDAGGVLSDKTIQQISGWGNTTCAIASSSAYCWGYGYSQLGSGVTAPQTNTTPVAVKADGALAGKTPVFIGVGNNNGCVVSNDGLVYCWGSNYSGQLGDGTTTSSSAPVAVDTSGVLLGKVIKSVAVGAGYICALDSNGQVYCWGKYSMYSPGASLPASMSSSGALSGKTVKKIVAGGSSASIMCALDTSNQIYCWGQGFYGELGTGVASASVSSPTPISTGAMAGKKVTDIAAAGSAVCAATDDGLVYCWGSNSTGQLGDGTTTDRSTPTAVNATGALAGKKIEKVIVGYNGYESCAVDTARQLYCWGNKSASNGSRSLVPVLTPVLEI